MSLPLLVKISLFAIVLLIAMSVATALIPGADKWPDAVWVVSFVAIALAGMTYLRKHGKGRYAEQGFGHGEADDSGRWKSGAVAIAMGALWLLGYPGSLLGYLLACSGAVLVIQYFWLKRKRTGQ